MSEQTPASSSNRASAAQILHARVIKDARTLDDLQKSLSYFNEVATLWEELQDRPALHAIYKAASVTYCRPFIPSRSPGARPVPGHPIREYQGEVGFDRSVHDHLLDLRNRFLAHADPYAFQPRLGRAVYQFDFDTGEQSTSTFGLFTCVYSWDGLRDRSYLDQILKHVDAFCRAVGSVLQGRLSQLQQILLANPDALGEPVDRRYSDRHRVESGDTARLSARDMLAMTWKEPETDIGGDRYRYRVANVVQPDPSLKRRTGTIAATANGPAEIDFS